MPTITKWTLTTITKWTLMFRMFHPNKGPWDWQDSNGKHHSGHMQSIQNEDGSGSSFNVTISDKGNQTTIHLRTID
jgi:hypothetical protein